MVRGHHYHQNLASFARVLTRSPPPLSQLAAALVPPMVARGRTVGATRDGLHDKLHFASTPTLENGIFDETGITEQAEDPSCDVDAKFNALLCKIANDTPPAAAMPPMVKKCSTIATCSAMELRDAERELLELAVRPWMPAKLDRSGASPPTVIPETSYFGPLLTTGALLANIFDKLYLPPIAPVLENIPVEGPISLTPGKPGEICPRP